MALYGPGACSSAELPRFLRAVTDVGLTGVGLVAASGDPDFAALVIIVGSALWCGALIKATIAATRAAKDVAEQQNRARTP